MKKKGVTLIELIVVIAILSIVLGMIYNVFISSNRIYKKGSEEFDIQSSARSVFLTVGEDIKKANYATVSKVTFISPNSIKAINSFKDPVTLNNIDSIAGSTFRSIYIEIDTTRAYIYVVKTVDGKKELHRIDCNSKASSVVSSNFEDIIFTENENIFTIDFSTRDKYSNVRKYSTSASIRTRK
jgi:prepilin-type N-terminal cleavage/methylation domain-containing protein